VSDDVFEALAERIEPGSTLIRTWGLKGGVSAQVTALELQRPDGRTERLIVRRHGATDLARNPQIAADEFKLLQVLSAAGVPAPRPRYLDAGGELLSAPCLVVDYVDGRLEPSPSDVRDFVAQLAAVLADVHRIDAAAAPFLPGRDLAQLPDARPADDPRVRAALQSALPLPQRNRSVLLHGDFWPGNTLWRDGRLAAVIDWEDAAVGDPLADVANARLELLWWLGQDAKEEFTHRYGANVAELDFTDLAYWDLWADLRLASRIDDWGLGAATKEAMRAGHEAFVAQALAELPARPRS
jgi:aminoglycoside phosphotransferase (APT) family kinase protein